MEGTCKVCGRRIDAERWEDGRRVCSRACRQQGVRPLDKKLEAAIVDLLNGRDRGATICPSEAARHLEPEGWRPLMERARRAARRLVAAGQVEVLQKGIVVDPSSAKGPIRLRKRST